MVGGDLRLGRITLASPLPPQPDGVPSSPVPARPVSLPPVPPARPPRRVALLSVAIVAAVAAVVLVLLLAGVLPGFHTASTGGSSVVLPYSQARTLADPAAANAAGGPWVLVRAVAADANSNASWEAALYTETFGAQGYRYLSPTHPGVPAFAGSYSSGQSPYWLLDYFNGTTLLAVVVVNGTATAWVTYTTPIYPPLDPARLAIPKTGLLDSPAVIAAAEAANASFQRTHPGLNASFTLEKGYFHGTLGYWWSVVFTSCAPFPQVFGNGITESEGISDQSVVNGTSAAATEVIPGFTHCSSFG